MNHNNRVWGKVSGEWKEEVVERMMKCLAWSVEYQGGRVRRAWEGIMNGV